MIKIVEHYKSLTNFQILHIVFWLTFTYICLLNKMYTDCCNTNPIRDCRMQCYIALFTERVNCSPTLAMVVLRHAAPLMDVRYDDVTAVCFCTHHSNCKTKATTHPHMHRKVSFISCEFINLSSDTSHQQSHSKERNALQLLKHISA